MKRTGTIVRSFMDFCARFYQNFTGVGRDGKKTGKDVQEHFKESLYTA